LLRGSDRNLRASPAPESHIGLQSGPEPASPGCKPGALPLDDTPMNRFPGLCGIQDSNLVSARHRVYSPARLSNSGATACVDPAGIEPAPTGFHPVAPPMSQRSMVLRCSPRGRTSIGRFRVGSPAIRRESIGAAREGGLEPPGARVNSPAGLPVPLLPIMRAAVLRGSGGDRTHNGHHCPQSFSRRCTAPAVAALPGAAFPARATGGTRTRHIRFGRPVPHLSATIACRAAHSHGDSNPGFLGEDQTT
jgi:hypothetical protein